MKIFGFFVIAPLVFLAACGGDDSASQTNASTSSPSNATYTISGSVDHLSGAGLVLSDGISTQVVNPGSTSFSFSTGLPSGTAYNVTVANQPTNENCQVVNGIGTVSDGNISNVNVACNTAVSQPVPIDIIPVATGNGTALRVFIPVAMVGNNNVNINAILDTGSAGVVLNALSIFPSSIVTSNGFNFPPGQNSITYNGITVTNVGMSKSYGGQSSNPHTDIGNIGFAQISFGSNGEIVTASIPILFVYQVQANGTTSPPTTLQGNIIGINSSFNSVQTVGSTSQGTTSTVCSLTNLSNCGLVSPFRSINFAQGVDGGFLLKQFSLQNCSINTPGSCQAQPLLTIGLNSTITQGFISTPLNCGTSTAADGSTIPTCSQIISGVTVSDGNSSFTGNVIFDSGAPTVRLSVPSGASFPQTLAPGSQINFEIPSGFTYQYTTGTGAATTTVGQSTSNQSFSNTGIEFFTLHSMYINYSTRTEGWY
ncbi:Uncharacterised protein [Burkholderia pseudomallei]|uniref:hypothetical protein n=1 Tax=Burkholderia pseudomallei TaxID=28450 RepID=UPI000F1EBAE3|nr:hypothetical protein [Burkholderia pseudomallei]CAJ7794762.1 Uncharacterised protein [Burkholderia pseudomallei]VCM82546.1 Uncharacterised protein [Burkholderia pseudomallei]